MSRTFHLKSIFVFFAVAAMTVPSQASGFGPKDKSAVVKVQRGGPLKGKSTLALGAFRVAFVTEDAANSESHGMFAGGGSAARMTGRLVGVDHALMQKITDAIYADFLKQAVTKGYTVIESSKLSETSTAYREMTAVPNFTEGRLGTFVIPTGQRSVEMAADNSAKEEKGSKGFGAAFHNIGKGLAKSDANKVFPAIGNDTGAAVLGVTIVVNFANFKGTSSSFGSSKATVAPGATIDGQIKGDASHSTSVMAWDAKTNDTSVGMAQVILEGQIHSDVSIGDFGAHSDMKYMDHVANGLSAALGAGGQYNKKASTLVANPEAYEVQVLAVATEANDLLLSAMAKEK